jgi:FMN phosphatase YigB (HAD superfamily)
MLIFDFDGVLIDSLDEVTVSANNAVTNSLITAIEKLPLKLVALFQRNRFHFQPAGDVIPLMGWCLKNYKILADKLLSAKEYREIIITSHMPLIERTNLFYAARKKFVMKNKQTWLSLHKPYQPLWNELIRRGGKRVVILTNKNREAVQWLCRHFGLNISRENIYSGDDGITKLTNLKKINERFRCGRYELIDDSIKNLRDLEREFNSRDQILFPILASWGYLGPTSKSQAHKHKYPVLNQNRIVGSLTEKLL